MLGTRLKELRKQYSITQSELASALNVAKTTVAAYEQEVNEPSSSMLGKLADYFHVTTDYLIGRTEGKTTDLQTLNEEIGLSEESILSLEAVKRISSNNTHTKNILENINKLIGDTETLLSISDYLNTKIDNGQYIVCKYYVSQNGEDLLVEPESSEKLLTKEQFSNIFFAEIQKNLNRLKNE